MWKFTGINCLRIQPLPYGILKVRIFLVLICPWLLTSFQYIETPVCGDLMQTTSIQTVGLRRTDKQKLKVLASYLLLDPTSRFLTDLENASVSGLNWQSNISLYLPSRRGRAGNARNVTDFSETFQTLRAFAARGILHGVPSFLHVMFQKWSSCKSPSEGVGNLRVHIREIFFDRSVVPSDRVCLVQEVLV